MALFEKPADYEAFERVLSEARERTGVRIAAYCLMPNHWHLLLLPQADGELSEVMRWITVTHTQRWHAHRHTAGTGPLYQGRFKSFAVQTDEHFLAVARYVERNALRAEMVSRAERVNGNRAAKGLLSEWPIARPRNWRLLVNRDEDEAELTSLRESVQRGRPFGSEAWQRRMMKRFGLESTFRPRGRPRKR